MAITYKDAGVDVEGGNRFVKKITPFVRSTFTKDVLADIGGFGSLYAANFKGMDEPVLVSGTDGVGTKLKVAQMMNKHDTIGIDAVAMCVNDIVTSGAKPLFFLDYISCGKLREDVLVDVVKGIAEGCLQSECSLVGGETAEHPGIMDPEDYDIAGFSVGVVDKKKIINGQNITPGDIIIGLPSSGIHSNGYSLVRKLLFEEKKYTVTTRLNDLDDVLGNVLLTPTKIYVKALHSALNSGLPVKGLVHITGGGFYENIPRILPADTAVKLSKNSYPVPGIFKLMEKEGGISEREMYTTFNMGIGMMLFIAKEFADSAMEKLKTDGIKPYLIGEVIKFNDAKVTIL
ncbi:MAG TPA: phosphoribosylformylglycinamidine cyclo-ligase [Spirochaetota bacterium]|nr:phosphoribosylformylglycinamidine cyclo-ligase [Spirochaetota bacterium]HPS88157.1 phosphoribosylformylglycinamidine cyclo-ligase [Spirochaetota bacterium]